MNRQQRNLIVVVATVFTIFFVSLMFATWWRDSDTPQADKPFDKESAVLSVVVISPQRKILPHEISAVGHVMAWQETSIGHQVDELQLAEVLVDVGDVVKQGQLLALFNADTVQAELVQSQATVEEAIALVAEAQADANRAREMQTTKALSNQQVQQYLTAEKTAEARLQLARAAERLKQVQLSQTTVRSPDDGIISARSATVGTVAASGAELFRLIRQSRLEWRAELAVAELQHLLPGQATRLMVNNKETVVGRLRVISPVVDVQTGNATVYVDLPESQTLRAGMFAQGVFELPGSEALTLPSSAVLSRDGFNYVFCVNQNSRVEQFKVTLGRRSGNLIEILHGLDRFARVVETGGGFLGEGDLVRVVEDKAVYKLLTRGDSSNEF